ncbi:hypothetical protein PT2222_340085 [Paraburkholderia tropica]
MPGCATAQKNAAPANGHGRVKAEGNQQRERNWGEALAFDQVTKYQIARSLYIDRYFESLLSGNYYR